MAPMMPPMPPDMPAGGMDPGMMGAPLPEDGGGGMPDQAMMQALQGMMGGGSQPGASTDPQQILEALTQMATSDQQQLAMMQQIEGSQLEEAQKQAMIEALQAMIQQLSQDALVPAGAASAAEAPSAMGPAQSPAIQEIMPPGMSRMSGEPVPDPYDIPPGY